MARYTAAMRIPHQELSPAVVRAIVEEFVTRDGTDHSSVESRVRQVLQQLEAGQVGLHFDDQTKTCNIVPKEHGVRDRPDDGGG